MPMLPQMAGNSGYSSAPSQSGFSKYSDAMGKIGAAGAIGRQFSALGGSQVQPIATGGGMQRRMSQIQDSPLMKINDSLNALQHIPDQKTREDLAYPLMKAEYMARNQKRGI